MYSFKARLTAGFIFLSALLSGCSFIAPQTYALKEKRPADLPARVELTQVPFYPQDDYYCGPSALAMAVTAAGVKVEPEDLVDQVYLPGRKGSLQVEMLAAARRRGLIAYELAPKVEDLLRELAAGTPAIVLENYGPFRWFPIWHYSVVVGYDLDRLEVIRRSAHAAAGVRKDLARRELLGDAGAAARKGAGFRHRNALCGGGGRARAKRAPPECADRLQRAAQALA